MNNLAQNLYNKLKKINLFIYYLAIILLITPLMIWSMLGDSVTVDEVSHIASGYSYVETQDYRLNPEHPPLLKVLSGLSMKALDSKINLNFDTNSPNWEVNPNQQWFMGQEFLFKSGNPTDLMVFFARIPNVIIFLILVWYVIYSVYHHTKSKKIALLSGIFTAFSPNIIAHSRLVTTDTISTLSFIMIADWFSRYLKNSSTKNILILSLVLVFGMLSKFSIVMLFPLFILIWLIYNYLYYKKMFLQRFILAIKHSLIFVVIMFFGISLVYQPINYKITTETQISLIEKSFVSDNQISDITKSILTTAVSNPLTKQFGHYLLGQFMVIQRVSGGNNTFLLGQFTNQSFLWYFPLTYIFKEPLSILILLGTTIMTFVFVILSLGKKSLNYFQNIYDNKSIYPIILLLIIIFYWGISISGNLNLGIRHILPVLPLTYILISYFIINYLVYLKFSNQIIAILIVWYSVTPFITFPHYISHFNLLIGNSDLGYQVFTDSNIDWGQDLKRLEIWMDEKNLDSIYLDFFGSYNAEVYLGDKYKPFYPEKGEVKGEYIAISASKFQDSFYKKQIGESEADYEWLKWKTPTEIIGNSILIYKIDN